MSQSEPRPQPQRHPSSGGHFGDPIGEQRRFFAGDSVVSCADHEVVELSGPDRLIWLDALATQQLTGVTPGTTVESLILDPQGHVEHGWLMVDDGQSSWLLVEPHQAEALVAWLNRMVFRYDVTITRRHDRFRVSAVWGEKLIQSLPPGALVWVDPWPGVVPGGFAYSADDHPGKDFALRFVATPGDVSVFDQVTPAGSWVLDAAEIRSGRPRLLTERDDKTLPHEMDWLRTAVHLNKGCYRGQETVAKVHNLGHPPRRLVLLHLDGSESVLPHPGDAVVDGELEVGKITRAVSHHEWGPIALAIIKRRVPGHSPLSVLSDGVVVAATQEVLVGVDAGRVAPPSLSRR